MKRITFILTLAVLCLCVSCKKEKVTPDNNQQQQEEPTPTDEGALNGVFSIGANKQVKFSKGNLQYQATTKTWRFAENQYDFVGAANANASASYGGWIDLFGWATSGWNCGNTYYMPYDRNFVDSYTQGMGYGPLPVGERSLNGEFANCDWGVYNAISNGGNQAGLWRTMTGEEWTYLFKTRPNAAQKYGIACIEGNNGMVVLPDNWTLPEGCTFNSGLGAGDGSEYFAQKNYYSKEQWNKMENNGALFFPAGGGYNGDEREVTYAGEVGRYWTINCVTEAASWMFYDWCAYAMYFDSQYMDPCDLNSPRYYGRSVRLVKDIR